DRAQPCEHRIVERFVRELGEAALAACETDGRRVIDRVLRLQRPLQILLVTKVEHERRDPQAYRAYPRRIGLVALADAAAAVDRRMHDETARVRLVRVHAKAEVVAEPFGDLAEVVACGGHRREPARTFEAALAGREIRL